MPDHDSAHYRRNSKYVIWETKIREKYSERPLENIDGNNENSYAFFAGHFQRISPPNISTSNTTYIYAGCFFNNKVRRRNRTDKVTETKRDENIEQRVPKVFCDEGTKNCQESQRTEKVKCSVEIGEPVATVASTLTLFLQITSEKSIFVVQTSQSGRKNTLLCLMISPK